jgi:hypothetical protein
MWNVVAYSARLCAYLVGPPPDPSRTGPCPAKLALSVRWRGQPPEGADRRKVSVTVTKAFGIVEALAPETVAV